MPVIISVSGLRTIKNFLGAKPYEVNGVIGVLLQQPCLMHNNRLFLFAFMKACAVCLTLQSPEAIIVPHRMI